MQILIYYLEIFFNIIFKKIYILYLKTKILHELFKVRKNIENIKIKNIENVKNIIWQIIVKIM